MGKYDALKPILNESQPRVSAEPARKIRPVAKSRSSEYRQISVYIRRTVHDDALRRLIGSSGDFSDLINRLVSDWLERGAPSA
jgi:hypothetical protein